MTRYSAVFIRYNYVKIDTNLVVEISSPMHFKDCHVLLITVFTYVLLSYIKGVTSTDATITAVQKCVECKWQNFTYVAAELMSYYRLGD